VMEVLAELDADLARTLTVVRNGIEKLRRERQFQEASEPAPSDDSLYSE
jgi:hypothetical protein